MREYRLIDADCHVVEPPHIWDTWLGEEFRERAPKLVKDEEGGDAWQFQPGAPLMYIGLVATPGMRFEDIKWKGYTYDTVRPIPILKMSNMLIAAITHPQGTRESRYRQRPKCYC